ncbi:MAG: preprotein translocase subunit SecG [Candidatus Cloacimonetes bacterium]|jgi:preprotein translocase subunit SecG|nr:preprotein translocase subunit SecG [Candidatus Cloacimonadota bacterium]MDY0298936.1 preprotein translocase subunit SecG [Candidatus Cloacimonadaceae bacterium]MCB5279637.1 preprotein translocase subunit SecG [Candidatus Cloacimonadota bacterium]MCK9333488.1 preprotein translocase subunit SecG [Candidatus Cloacimonadota bacterium]MDD2210472.1 preprotein translocase subunit SecG [Candidatus Cloacimonadota bacterium]
MVLYTIALVIHVIISVALVLVILAQTSKGGLDANLGGAAMNVFGGSGASQMLKKWTQILALIFAASCILLAFLVKDMRGGTLSEVQERQSKLPDTETPAEPATAPAPIPAETPSQGE